jgi:hypothetical protein
MGGHGTEVEVRSTNQIKGIYSNKKKHNEKFGKTQKKLPDLATSGFLLILLIVATGGQIR